MYIVKKKGPKPFLEFGMIRRRVPENNIDTFRYVCTNNKGQIKFNKFGHYSDGDYILCMTSHYLLPFFHKYHRGVYSYDFSVVSTDFGKKLRTTIFAFKTTIVIEMLKINSFLLKIYKISIFISGRLNCKKIQLNSSAQVIVRMN